MFVSSENINTLAILGQWPLHFTGFIFGSRHVWLWDIHRSTIGGLLLSAWPGWIRDSCQRSLHGGQEQGEAVGQHRPRCFHLVWVHRCTYLLTGHQLHTAWSYLSLAQIFQRVYNPLALWPFHHLPATQDIWEYASLSSQLHWWQSSMNRWSNFITSF